MQLPYTVKAKKAIDIAGKMSKSLHHNYIGTEHLLIGLLKENSGVAAKILNENGVELDKIVDLIKELIAPAEGTAVAESDGYSPRAAKVLENAEKEAVRFHADAIGTEHILIGLLREKEGLACNAVRQYAESLCGHSHCDGGRCKSLPRRISEWPSGKKEK